MIIAALVAVVVFAAACVGMALLRAAGMSSRKEEQDEADGIRD